jgi:hypothetical protein
MGGGRSEEEQKEIITDAAVKAAAGESPQGRK